MKLKAVSDKIIVEKKKHEQVSEGGIIFLSPDKDMQHFEGTVVDVGSGNVILGHLFPFEVKPKDKVLFVKHGGTELSVQGNDYVILKEQDILAIIDENNELIPIGDILLCERCESIKETESGIIFSTKGLVQDKAKVLKKGKGRYTYNGKYEDFGIEEGEIVYFDSNRGINVEWNHKKYFFLGMTTVIATSGVNENIEITNQIF